MPNKQASYAGHYKAYDLGIPTAFKRAKWGTVTVYLVTVPDVETEVTRLLADTRTGALGTPSAGRHLLGAGRDSPGTGLLAGQAPLRAERGAQVDRLGGYEEDGRVLEAPAHGADRSHEVERTGLAAGAAVRTS